MSNELPDKPTDPGEFYESWDRARWPLVRLTIECAYTTATGAARVFLTETTWDRVMHDEEHVAALRQHAFRRFDHAFFNELLKRGEFYGSRIEKVQSWEERTDHAIMPNERLTDLWTPATEEESERERRSLG